MGTDNKSVVYGIPDLLDKLMPSGYKVCRKCMGSGRLVDFDELNDMGAIRFELCKACSGDGFIKEDKTR